MSPSATEPTTASGEDGGDDAPDVALTTRRMVLLSPARRRWRPPSNRSSTSAFKRPRRRGRSSGLNNTPAVVTPSPLAPTAVSGGGVAAPGWSPYGAPLCHGFSPSQVTDHQSFGLLRAVPHSKEEQQRRSGKAPRGAAAAWLGRCDEQADSTGDRAGFDRFPGTRGAAGSGT